MKVCDPVVAPKLESFQLEMVTEQKLLLKNQTWRESEILLWDWSKKIYGSCK